jgi:hypothetical protein
LTAFDSQVAQLFIEILSTKGLVVVVVVVVVVVGCLPERLITTLAEDPFKHVPRLVGNFLLSR